MPEHQGGGVTNGDLGYPTTTTSVAPARHLQRTAPNQDKKKKKKKEKYNHFASLAKFNKQPKSAGAIRNR